MANNSFELSQPGIDNLNSSLDKLVVSMNSLERRLASLTKNQKSAFDKVFGSQKDFDLIIKSVNKLNTTGVDGLKSITSSIKSLALALGALPAKSQAIPFLKQFITLTTALGSAKFGKATGFSDFVTVLTTVAKQLASIDAVGTDATKAVSTIAKALRVAIGLAADRTLAQITAAQLRQFENVKRLITLFKAMALSFADIPSIPKDATGSVNLIAKAIRASASLAKDKDVLAVTKETIRQIESVQRLILLLKTTAKAFDAIPKINDDAIVSINAIAKGIRAAAALAVDKGVLAFTKASITQIENVERLIDVLKLAAISFKDLPKLGENTAQTLNVIAGAVRTAARLADDKDVLSLDGAKVNQVKNVTNLIEVYRSIVEGMGLLDRLAPNAIVSLRNLGTFGKSVADLGRGFKLMTEAFADIKEGSVRKITLILGAFSLQFRTIAALTQTGSSLENLSMLGRTFDQIGRGLVGMTRAADQINLKQVAKIGLIVLAISTAFTGIAKLVSSLPGSNSLKDLSSSFTAISTSLAYFTKLADSLNFLRIIFISQKLKLVFQAIGAAFATAANNVAKNQGLDNLTKLSEAFARLGPALASILKVSEGLPTFNPKAIVKKFFEIRSLIKTVAQIASGLAKEANKLAKTKGLQNLDQLSVIFDRLGRGIRSLIGAMVVVDKAKLTNLNPVKELFKSLDPLFKQLRKFKGAELPDFGPTFDALFKFANSVDGDSFDAKALKGFKNFTKGLAEGLKELFKLRADPAKIKALVTLLDSLRKLKGDLGSLNLAGAGAVGGGVGVPLGRELSDEVAEGFLAADLRKKLFNVLFAVFKALNPFTLARDFITGMVGVFNKLASAPDLLLNKLKQVGQSLISLGSQLRTSGLSLFNSIGLGGIANSSLFQAAVGFDDLSTQVENFGNLTKEQLKSAQEFSNEIGIKYPQSSNEALQATLNLLKAGLDLNDTFTALPAAADLSSISDSKNLDAASKAIILVTQSFKDFNEETVASFENASVAADLIARAANNSTASVESLTEGLANVGPTAASFGLSLEETVAILGQFEDSGIRGAEAGTQLKSLLTNITRSTPEVKAEFARLGVSLTDSEGNFRRINDIVNDLNSSMLETKTVTFAVNNATADQRPRLDAATKAYASAARQVLIYNDGLSTGALDQEKANKKLGELQQVQANAAAVIAEITGSQATTETITRDITRSQSENFRSIQTLAGSFGQAGLNILISSGQDAIAGFIDEMGRLPTAAEQARLLLDNLKGDALQLQGSIESLGTRAFLPLIHRVFRPLVKIGRLVVDFFSSLSDPILETIVNAGVLVSIMATLAGGLLIAVGVLTQFGGIILTVVGTLGGLLVNLPLVVGALAGLVASFAAIIALAAVIVPVLLGISSVITSFFRVIENNVGGAGEALGRVQETFGSIFAIIGDIVSTGAGIFASIFGDTLDEANVQRGERIAAFFSDINKAITGFRSKLIVVQTLFTGFRDFLLLGEGDTLKNSIFDKLIAQGVPVSLALAEAERQVKSTEGALRKALFSIANSSVGEALFGKNLDITKVEAAFESIKRNLLIFKAGVLDVVGGIGGSIFGALGLGDEEQTKAANTQLKKGLNSLSSLLTKGLQKITGLDLSSALLEFDAGDLETGAQNLISALFTSLKTTFFANQGKITDILAGVFNFLVPGKFIEPLLRFFGLDSLADSIGAVFDDISKLIRGAIGAVFDTLKGESLDDALFGNFGTAAKPLSRLIKSIGKAIESLVGIFSDLFAVLFPTGIGSGGSFLETVIDGIASAFEFFTTAVLQPLRVILPNLIQILATLADTVITVVSGLFNVISKVAGPLTTLFSSLFSGDIDFGGFLAGLGPAVLSTLQGLIQALPGLIGTLLSGIGALIGSPLLTAIGTDLQNGDFEGAISTIAIAVGGVISSAISRVPGLLTDLGTLLGAPLITKIGEALATGDFSTVGTQIKTSIEGAINSIPSKLVELGTTFGSPLLVKLGEALSTSDASGAISAITDSIASAISGALGDIPARLAELGVTLNLGFLSDLGITLEQSELFDKVITGLGNLIALPFETLATIVGTLSDFGDGLGKLFENLGKANPLVVGALVLTLGGLFALLTGPALIAGLGLLAGALTPVLLPILTVAAVLLVLKNGLQAVADVISGKKNVFEGISGFFTGLASDALGLVGIEISPEEIADRITTFFNSVNGLLQLFFANAINQAKTAITNLVDGLIGGLDDAQARFDASVLGQQTGSGNLFFGIEQSIKDSNFRAISDQLNEAAEKGFDLEPFRRLLRNNFQGVIDTFVTDIPKLADFSDADFGAVIDTLVNANALDDAINKLPPELVPDFYKRLFAVEASDLTGLDFSTIQTQLTTGLSTGLFDFSQVEGFVLSLPGAVLSPEAKAAFLASLQTQITPTTPTEVPLQITPTVLPATEEDKNKVRTDIGLGLLLSGDSGVPVTVPLDVTPTVTPPTAEQVQQIATDSVTPTDGVAPAVELPVDVTAITDPATAQAFADALATVTTNSDAAAISLTALQGQTILIKDDIILASTSVAQYAVDVTDNTLIAETGWTTHSLIVTLALQRIVDTLSAIKLRLVDIGVEIDKANTTFPEKLVTLGNAFASMVNVAEPPLRRLSSRLQEVSTNLQNVLNQLSAVAAAGITINSSGQGNVPGGRKDGGSVFANQLYEVGEEGRSELLRIGGRTYLIPGGNGMVIPASSMSNAAPPPSLNNSRSSTNNNSVSIQAPITVEVIAGSNANPQQIGQQVANRVSPLIDNLAIDVKRKLLLTGRT